MHKIKAHLMCNEIDKIFPLEPFVRDALESVDREIFVSNSFAHLAYSLDALPMDARQWISSPLTVAKMTQFLTPGDSVLEIGLGSGYQAMVLSKIFRRVFSIERIERLLLEARKKIRLSNTHNIHTKFADGLEGWAQYAPYDRILLSACLGSKIPQTLIDQLEEGGILVAPILESNSSVQKDSQKDAKEAQVIKRFKKRNGILCDEETLESCLFVPILKGVAH